MKINLNWLKKKGGVCNQLFIFKKLFPKGAELTLNNLLICAINLLDINWFAEKLLDDTDFKKYLKEIENTYNQHQKEISSISKKYFRRFNYYFNMFSKEMISISKEYKKKIDYLKNNHKDKNMFYLQVNYSNKYNDILKKFENNINSCRCIFQDEFNKSRRKFLCSCARKLWKILKSKMKEDFKP